MAATNMIAAVSLMTDAATLLQYFASRFADASATIHLAQSQGRDLTDDELMALEEVYETAQNRLKAMIKSKG